MAHNSKVHTLEPLATRENTFNIILRVCVFNLFKGYLLTILERIMKVLYQLINPLNA